MSCPLDATTDIRIGTPRGEFAALRWHGGGPRVLCLHGWLDNAASFVPLIRHLPAFDVLALDFAGHGKSQHRHPTANYYFTEYLWDIEAVLNALNWPAAHLLGHSLGGGAASMYAAAAPERVLSLTMIDSLGPISASPRGEGDRLKRSLDSLRHPRPKKTYAAIEDMMAARQANGELTQTAARLICERAARRTEAGYEWTTDPALHWVSPVLFTEEQVLDCLSQIAAPALAVLADPLPRFLSHEWVEHRAAAIRNCRVQTITGTHHFHMDRPQPLAALIKPFIMAHDPGTAAGPGSETRT